MNTYTAIILAYQYHEISKKNGMHPSALLPVHGKPMFNWIIDILRGSTKIRDLIVIGPETLDGLLGMRYVTKRISPANATVENLMVQFFSPDSPPQNNGYLVIPSETIFIKSAEIDHVLSEYDLIRSEIAVPVIETDKLKQFHESAPELIQIKDNLVSGLIAITKEIQYIGSAITVLNKFHPEQNLLEYRDQTFSFLTDAFSKHLPPDRIKLLHTSMTSFFISVNSAKHFALAQKLLTKPYRNRFSKIKLILNPKSGKSKRFPFIGKLLGVRYRSIDTLFSPHQFQNRILEYLNEFGIDAELIKSKSSENATEIARNCSKSNYDLVIAAGGDGTINSVINGLAGTQTTFAAIPAGTVNVFALQLNIPVEIRSACELIAMGNVKQIDLGKVNEHYFSCLSGIGFEAYIMNKTRPDIKGKIGPAAYVLSGIRHFFGYRFSKIYFTIDNKPQRDYGYIIVVSNGKYYSANMILSPAASMEDGLLDIIVFKSKNPISFLRYFYKLENVKLSEYPDIKHLQVKKIKIEKHGNHYVHVDGEHYGHTPVEIDVVPSSLKVIC
ncbi:MAG TPA: diacylglycerol kinase family protein [Chitinispirillaceae bacterium]|nr:diacylglycerol kinase family protein [Chitinispirillaceae bacterium]